MTRCQTTLTAPSIGHKLQQYSHVHYSKIPPINLTGELLYVGVK